MILDSEGSLLSKKEWLGESEKIVFQHLKDTAEFVSPFSINNPNGWRYWLMHFANSYRARQVYNDVLHQDGDAQAHVGRAGLYMLSYDPQYETQIYLFDNDSRSSSREELHDDIPRLLSSNNKFLIAEDLYKKAYSETPAHSDDIHEIIINSNDIEVLTKNGGKRRAGHTISKDDVVKLVEQRSMLFMRKN